MKTPTINWASEPNVVLLMGSEDFFKDQLLGYARMALDDYRQVMFWAGLDSDTMIRNHLFEGSLVPVKKLIVIRDANKVSNEETLKKYCESPNPDAVVVLVASSGRKPNWFKGLKCNARAKCDKPKPWEIKDWVVDYCRHKGYSIPSQLAEALHSNVGTDLFALANELEKVFLNMDEGDTRIGPSDITSVLVQHESISPFKVVEAWCLQDVSQSLRMAAIYFQQSSDSYASLPLIAIFLNQIERMIHWESLSTREYRKQEICSRMGISAYVHDEIQRQVTHWSLVDLRKAYALMCEVEEKVKSGSNSQLLVNWFLSQDFAPKE